MPAHPPLESLDFRQRRARHDDVADVLLREMDEDAIDVIELERAPDAALAPVRAEHEMLDDQLAAPAEQVGQRLRAARPVEGVILFDLYPGQCPPLGAEPIAQPGELLFLAQELGPR